MKTIFTAALLIILALDQSYAANITAIQDGNWTSGATWDLNRVPQDGDDVTIPAGITVMFTNTPYPQNNPPARPTFSIRIYGTLDFSSPGNDKLYLDAGSKIQIYTGGKIQTTTSSTEIIAIYNGSVDNTVWTGTPSTINGPASATATTSGFANGLLPVKIQSFESVRSGENNVRLIWITSMEANSAYFEIQSFDHDRNTWNKIGQVSASGNSSVQKQYSFETTLNNGINEFRLKQVDVDGKFIFSQVIKVEGRNHVSAFYYDQHSHEIIFTTPNRVDVTVYNLTGNRMLSAKVTSHVRYRPVQPGVYIVQVADNGMYYSQKVYMR